MFEVISDNLGTRFGRAIHHCIHFALVRTGHMAVSSCSGMENVVVLCFQKENETSEDITTSLPQLCFLCFKDDTERLLVN